MDERLFFFVCGLFVLFGFVTRFPHPHPRLPSHNGKPPHRARVPLSLCVPAPADPHYAHLFCRLCGQQTAVPESRRSVGDIERGKPRWLHTDLQRFCVCGEASSDRTRPLIKPDQAMPIPSRMISTRQRKVEQQWKASISYLAQRDQQLHHQRGVPLTLVQAPTANHGELRLRSTGGMETPSIPEAELETTDPQKNRETRPSG